MKRILMDLHPCFDGFAGIPQDTRVSYSLLSESEKFEVGGHLYHSSHGTTGFPWKSHAEPDELINQMSEYIIALSSDQRRYDHGAVKSDLLKSVLAYLNGNYQFRKIVRFLTDRGTLKPESNLHDIDSSFFQDYLWRALFEKSLTSDKRHLITKSTFLGGSISRALSSKLLLNNSPAAFIDTADWDFYLSQTAMPAKISEHTQLLIRFHDAVPIQYPTTISNPYQHHQSVKNALKLCQSGGHFICNSHSTREQLLSIYPSLEKKCDVVYCCVPDTYKKTNPGSVKGIVAKRTRPETVNAEGFSNIMKYKQFVESNFNEDYFIAVGTIEPRKNYSTILEAWDRFRKETGKDIKLILVGNRGWGEDSLDHQICSYSHDGDLYLLQEVSLHELIDLYSMARALIVASYTEGFSYSGIEAMRCETPVIASDILVHKEVYGDNAYYFDPYSKNDLVHSMRDVVNTSSADIKNVTKSALDFSMRYSERPIRDSWDRVLTSLS